MADTVPTCPSCGHPHLTATGKRACTGHVTTDRDSYVKGQDRALLPEPRACRRNAMNGLDVCASHGGRARQVKAAGAQRTAEAKAEAAARKLIPDLADRTRITNPLETLLDLASELNAFRESLRIKANGLDSIRYTAAGAAGEQIRAEVALYRQAIKDTTDVLVQIARLDIEKMLARITLAQAEQALAAFRAGMDEANLTDEQRRTVIGSASRHLRSITGGAA